jgi:hypothetical protein
MKKTQLDKILGYLRTGRRLTKSVASTRFGVVKLSARIRELRVEGFDIATNVRNVNGRKAFHYSMD